MSFGWPWRGAAHETTTTGAGPRLRPGLIALIAGAAGFAVNGFGLTVLAGTEIIFGGLFSLPVALRFGPWWGGFTAFIAFSRTLLWWGYPMGLVCYTGEAAAAGWLAHRRNWHPLTALTAYWAIIGLPAITAYVWWNPRAFPFPNDLAVVVKYPFNTLLVVGPAVSMISRRCPVGVLARWLGHRPDGATEPLRRILFARFGAMAVIPVVVLSVLFGHVHDQSLRSRAAVKLADDAQQIATLLRNHLQENRRAVETLAGHIERRLPASPGEVERSLEMTRLQYAGLLTLMAAAPDGTVVATAQPPSLRRPDGVASVRDRDYFTVPLTTGRSHVSGVLQGRGLGHDLIVALSAPVIDRGGRVAYVVEGSLNLEGLDALLRHFGDARRKIVVVDNRGQVVVASPGLQLVPLGNFRSHGLASLVQDATGSFTYDLRERPGARPERYTGALRFVDGYGWQAYLIEPSWNTQRVISAYYLVAIVCTGLSIALVLLAAQHTAVRITTPLNRLVEATRALARQQPARIEADTAHSSQELVEISQSLHETALTLSRSNADLRQAVREREQTHQQLRLVLLHLDERVQQRTRELEESRKAAEVANQAKSEFLASMSHELRTPLNVVLGMADVLQEETVGPLTPRQHDCVEAIQEGGRHLLALINDVLDLSKIEAGMLQLEIQATDVRDVCEASARFVRQMAEHKRIALTCQVAATTSTVQADARRLKQILVNLLHNAVKFTPEGGRVVLRVTETDSPPALQFAVEDNGIGIAPEHLPRLFKSFVQVDSSLTRAHAGTGLGLALVDKMTRLQGGTVAVESTPGEGSRFTITLPLDRREVLQSPIEPELPRRDGVYRIPGKPLVLIADDQPMNVEFLSHIVTAAGCRVATACSGRHVLEQAAALQPDVVIMDVQMPEMDGLEATRRLRATPRLAHIPVIVVTALAMPMDGVLCLEAGASAYFSKPVDPNQLRRGIADLLGRQDPMGAARAPQQDAIHEESE